jgi:hypothetical protein
MDAERDEVCLTGDLREKQTLTEELRKFVRQVTVAEKGLSPLPFDMLTLQYIIENQE